MFGQLIFQYFYNKDKNTLLKMYDLLTPAAQQWVYSGGEFQKWPSYRVYHALGEAIYHNNYEPNWPPDDQPKQ